MGNGLRRGACYWIVFFVMNMHRTEYSSLWACFGFLQLLQYCYRYTLECFDSICFLNFICLALVLADCQSQLEISKISISTKSIFSSKCQFRLHKSVTNTNQLDHFFDEWGKYLSHIERSGREKQSMAAGLVDSSSMGSSSASAKSSKNNVARFGKDVSDNLVFNEEQGRQLGKLREEALKGEGRK